MTVAVRTIQPLPDSLVTRDRYFVAISIVYIMLFEWTLFEARSLLPAVNFLKLVLPAALLAVLPGWHSDRRASRYVIWTVLFCVWMTLISALSPYASETAIQAAKVSVRFFFVLVALSYVMHHPQSSLMIIKVLIGIGVASVIQYAVLLPFFYSGTASIYDIPGARGRFYGPFGLLGSQLAAMNFSGGVYTRLTGFWLEPSNASGYLASTGFLALAMLRLTDQRRWRTAAIILFVGSLLSLSNAGYLAIAGGAAFGGIVRGKGLSRARSVILGGLVTVVFAGIALMGREYVLENYSENELLRAITGTRSAVETDVTGGRLDDAVDNVALWREHPLGMGVRIPGDDFFEEASASAPITWITYTGFIGFTLLLLTHAEVAVAGGAPNNGFAQGLGQAWAAIYTQNLINGSWISPHLLMLGVLAIAAAAQHTPPKTVTSPYRDGVVGRA